MYEGQYLKDTRLKMISILGEQGNYDDLYDCIIELFPKFSDIPKEKQNTIYIELLCLVPDDILGSAYSWGLSDTVVRDSIYEFIDENMEEISRLIGL